MSALLIGYRKFTSKKGTNCCIVSLVNDYSDFDGELPIVLSQWASCFIDLVTYYLHRR